MRKRTRLTLLLTMLCTLCSIGANADNLLTGKKWSKLTKVGGTSGTPQGAAYLDGKIYQFTTNCAQYGVYDVSGNAWSAGEALNTAPLNACHFGSASFNTSQSKNSEGKYEYKIGDTSYTSAYPLLFVTHHANNNILIYVIDFETKKQVATFQFPHTDKRDDMIAAYDFDNGTIYILGYPTGVTGKSPYYIWTYTGVDFSDLSTTKTMPSLTTATTTATTTDGITVKVSGPIGGPDTSGDNAGIQTTLACGTLQDCVYNDGYIYVATGRGSSNAHTEFPKVHAINLSNMTVETSMVSTSIKEAEGFAFDGSSFYLSDGAGQFWKISSDVSGYDSYNFQPAELVTDGGTYDGYYKITNASQLIWFKSQVYAGRTTLKAYLANDIDMTGVTDPYSNYIYYVGDGYDTQYAFRGTFDGANHTIKNYCMTTQSDYSDNGLFPYCIGATIKDMTVTGRITLNKAVSNVGLIGYMDGGTVTGVDVTRLIVDTGSYTTDTSVNNLIGGRGTNEITESDNITTTYTHDANGHVYKNGFCISSGTCDTPYEEPSTVDNVYQITNGGNLFWFAKYVNSGNASINALLTKDIDLEDQTNGSFPGIGKGTAYTGTFDGNGKTISNFYQKFTSGNHTGLFYTISGSAVVKYFNINGTIDITNSDNAQQFGGAVGYAVVKDSNIPTIEDVHSSVDINITGKVYTVGGIVGRSQGIVNRCWYSGTITVGANTYMRIGGIIGEPHGSKCVVKNCLFDGTIAASSSSDQLCVGGIVGGQSETATATISNCLSNGTISIPNSTGTYSGIVIGMSQVALKANTCYYTTTNVDSKITNATSVEGEAVTGTPEFTTAVSLTSGYLLYNLQQNLGTNSDNTYNWSAGTSYPIPVVGTTAGSNSGTYRTITFNNSNGKLIQKGQVEDGGTIIAPTPYRYGYIFKEWSPALAATASANATYTAMYDEMECTGTFSNGFNTDASCSEYNKYEKPTLNSDGYYEIDNGGKLFWFARFVNKGNTSINAKLTVESIDLENRAFTPIGESKYYKYTGTFDGNGKTISNLNITRSDDYTGLFGYTKNATIQNFTLQGSMTMSSGSYVGSVVGCAENTTMQDVTSSVKITHTGEKNYIGGIAGRFYGTINRCRYSGTLDCSKAHLNIGGVIANAVNGTTKMSNCLFDGTINATSTNKDLRVGGLIAYVENNKDNTMSNCMSHGTITLATSGGTTEYTGVLVGKTNTNVSIKLTTCYYTAITDLNATSSGTYTYNVDETTDVIATGESPAWDDICTALNDGSKAAGNWQIKDKEYPIPSYFTHQHKYADGYCSQCSATEPMGVDATDGYYTIANCGQMATFRDLVNNSALGTQINAKLTGDIDLSNTKWSNDDMIGSSSRPYCGTFDGQGHKVIKVHVCPTTAQRYVGLFACVGINGDKNNKNLTSTDLATGIIKNISVEGSITNNYYYCNQDVDEPLDMGTIGEIFNGTIQNVHSSVNLSSANASRVQVGGITGGTHQTSGKGSSVLIDQCSYTGTISVNGFDDISGIIGYIQNSTTVSNCLYNGHITQTYDDSSVSNDDKGSTELYTQMGGIAGYVSASCKNVSINNNLVLGDFTTPTSIYDPSTKANVSFETSAMNYAHNDDSDAETPHHNVNAFVGYANTANTVSNCYLSEKVKISAHESTPQLDGSSCNITVNSKDDDTFDRGMVCAEMNGNVTDGNPWGQVLGYQLGWDGNRYCDPNSPSELYPSPGYVGNNGPTYKVVKDASNNYTADYYFFDDYGDTTPMPTDANSMKVKKIQYTRRGETYMKGYISVCLPYDLTTNYAPSGDTKYYKYDSRDGNTVKFTTIELPIEKGTPFIMYNTSKADWAVLIDKDAGTDVKLKADDYDTNVTATDKSVNLPENDGLYGTFNTRYLDNSSNNFFKLNEAGTAIQKATSTFNCWPFRAYFRLPKLTGAAKYSCLWNDEEDLPTQIDFTESDGTHTVVPAYSVFGQQVPSDTKGIVIINGKKYLNK